MGNLGSYIGCPRVYSLLCTRTAALGNACIKVFTNITRKYVATSVEHGVKRKNCRRFWRTYQEICLWATFINSSANSQFSWRNMDASESTQFSIHKNTHCFHSNLSKGNPLSHPPFLDDLQVQKWKLAFCSWVIPEGVFLRRRTIHAFIRFQRFF